MYASALSVKFTAGIFNATEDSPKESIEIMIAEHGGSKVQSPTPNTFCVIASHLSMIDPYRLS